MKLGWDVVKLCGDVVKLRRDIVKLESDADVRASSPWSEIVFIAALGWRACLLFRGDGPGVGVLMQWTRIAEQKCIHSGTIFERTYKETCK